MTLLVRDEADIVEANVDYHLSQGVDFVIATDHSSRDATADLLRRYERQGSLLLLEAEGEAHDQVTHVNAMARAAVTDHGADWVINNDADEFWWPLVGNLKDILGAVPDQLGGLQVSRFNFLPRPDGSEPFLERMVVRETASKNGRGDPLEPKIIHRATPEIEMAPGNHSIDAPDVVVAPDLGLLEVLHFPARSFGQFERKVLNVGIGYERLVPRGAEVGRDQLALLELQREGRLRRHFDSLAVDEAGLAAAVATGRVIVDTRLRDHMAALDSGRTDLHPAPDAAGARRMASAALGTAAELGTVRAELDTVRRELETVRAALATRHEELEAARADHERLEGRLASTDATLHALQTSRLVRYSKGPRRLYHRLRGRIPEVNRALTPRARKRDAREGSYDITAQFERNAPYAPTPDNRPVPLEAAPLPLARDGISQMSFGERAALEGVLGQVRPKLALEIGTAQGGSLRRIAVHSAEVHSIDIDHDPVRAEAPLPSHVTLHTGSSGQLLPRLLASFADSGRHLDFALVDGDHSFEGVAADLRALLRSPATQRTVILVHDSMNAEVRAGIQSVGFDDYEKVVYHELDFVPGYTYAEGAVRGSVWGGIALVMTDLQRSAAYAESTRQSRYSEPSRQ